ncbi:uncharacterized protein A1O5_08523 [Cladophialophora psammophila CBS 110553]|uniref:NACHT domain-containing protein n=1 Tax=Cladophialophora psammophila CBS 110553 TaxID=1182543 RepID=W9XE70_9EURO|nr:uncharacterized protein A1O5_08523 [Cladophialophora psammophila CBS 110553]EXJ68729.1 hypothetical protein A1O5_08523 [Cladophialophora psammophila CBS 110553]
MQSAPTQRRGSIVEAYLNSLLDDYLSTRKLDEHGDLVKLQHNVSQILKAQAPSNERSLLAALCAAISIGKSQYSFIVLDCVPEEFIGTACEVINSLQELLPTLKGLLTTDCPFTLPFAFPTIAGINAEHIEFDQERRECINTLRFHNTRSSTISKECKGSCVWLWTHAQYRDWIASHNSRVLLVEGKPGSGKSTLTKYFCDHLEEKQPMSSSATVAKFFYSYREGEVQRRHYHMFRSLLHDILCQEEGFFYHQLQSLYRARCVQESSSTLLWSYSSLKDALRSLASYSTRRPVYLIIDAVDESEENDRRDMLNLLPEICATTRFCTVKIFVASRPIGQLELRKPLVQNFIRMQGETTSDIATLARFFLGGLNLTGLISQSLNYIVDNAQGVFLWVRLVGEELIAYEEKGVSEEEVFEFLKRLPTELEDFYRRMLQQIRNKEADLRGAVKMVQFILFAGRPVTVEEVVHALAVSENPATEFYASDEIFQRRIPSERYII